MRALALGTTVAAILIALALGARSAHAVSCDASWKSAVSGDWNDPTNWNPAVVPDATKVACIDVAGTYTVTIKAVSGHVDYAAAAAKQLSLGAGSGTQTVQIEGTDLSGTSESASLSLTDGGTVGANGRIVMGSDDSNTTADVDLCGGSTGLTNLGTIETDGTGGARTLRGGVSNQGVVDVNENTSVPSGSPCGSNSLTNAGGEIDIADLKTLTVDGSFSQSSGTTAVGNGLLVGSGDFAISGGSLTGDSPTLTGATVSPSGGSATITVEGTSGLASDVGPNIELDVLGTSTGNASLGTAVASDLTNAGAIHLLSNDAGHGAGLDASATVGGSMTNTGFIQSFPGSGGARHLDGEITNSGLIGLLADTTASSLDLTNNSTLTIANGKTFTVDGSGVTQSAGTLTVDGNLTYTGAGSLPVQGGTLRGAGTITGDVTNTGGTVHPGHSPGVLTVSGNYTQGAGGTLALDLAGSSPGTGFSKLTVSGSASLGGTLDLTNGFTPAIGDTFQVVTATGVVSNGFASTVVHGPTHYAVHYNANDVTLEALATLAVSKAGSGNGRITSSPAGIDCGPTCTGYFTNGQQVTLSAHTGSSDVFTGWTGSGCSGTSTCTVTMSQAHSVIAHFAHRYRLRITKTGPGGGTVTSFPGTIDCGAVCSNVFLAGTKVTLTAVPDGASIFAGWGGACAGTGTCTVKMSRARSVTAVFSPVLPATIGRKVFRANRFGVVPIRVTNPNPLRAKGSHLTATTVKKHLRIGRKKFSVSAHGTKRARLHLTRRGWRLLRRRRKLRVVLTIAMTVGGRSVTSEPVVTFRAPTRRHRRH